MENILDACACESLCPYVLLSRCPAMRLSQVGGWRRPGDPSILNKGPGRIKSPTGKLIGMTSKG